MITLQFSTTPAWGSEAIRIFSRGWPSHVDIVMDDGTLIGARSDAVGGKPPGVQARPPNYEVWTRTEIIRLACTPAVDAAFHAFIVAQLGKPYDELAIVAFPIERDWRRPDTWICSELGAAGLENSLWFPQPLAGAVNEVTPRDLLLIVSPWAMR
jgi:hypothetical protein